MKWIISNHKEQEVETTYFKRLKNLDTKDIHFIICPNNKVLPTVEENSFILGSQDMNEYSVEELKNLSVKYTIVGHFDTRKKYQETNKEIQKKIKALLENNICPILCVGEENKGLENIKELLSTELEESLIDIKTDNLIIAYEPMWAINSGNTPNNQTLTNIISYIKEKTRELLGITPIVVYGGSVSLDTIEKLNQVKELDGYLIGNASLDIEALKEIIEVVK